MKLFGSMKNKNVAQNTTILSDDAPFAFAEAYKMLRTNLSFVSTTGKYKKILITSAIPNEGKSTVAINLAITLAEAGARVVVVDCDMRNPSVHRYLRLRNSKDSGLSSMLSGAMSGPVSIQTYTKGGFRFIPAGTIPPNPAELLGSERMKKVIETLEEHFDYIICDAPPTTVVSDAAVLSRYVDGVLLVVRQNFSTRQQVRAAKQSLDTVNANLLGAVLNQYDMSADWKKGGRYGYGNYKYKYTYSYGGSTNELNDLPDDNRDA